MLTTSKVHKFELIKNIMYKMYVHDIIFLRVSILNFIIIMIFNEFIRYLYDIFGQAIPRYATCNYTGSTFYEVVQVSFAPLPQRSDLIYELRTFSILCYSHNIRDF